MNRELGLRALLGNSVGSTSKAIVNYDDGRVTDDEDDDDENDNVDGAALRKVMDSVYSDYRRWCRLREDNARFWDCFGMLRVDPTLSTQSAIYIVSQTPHSVYFPPGNLNESFSHHFQSKNELDIELLRLQVENPRLHAVLWVLADNPMLQVDSVVAAIFKLNDEQFGDKFLFDYEPGCFSGKNPLLVCKPKGVRPVFSQNNRQRLYRSKRCRSSTPLRYGRPRRYNSDASEKMTRRKSPVSKVQNTSGNWVRSSQVQEPTKKYLSFWLEPTPLSELRHRTSNIADSIELRRQDSELCEDKQEALMASNAFSDDYCRPEQNFNSNNNKNDNDNNSNNQAIAGTAEQKPPRHMSRPAKVNFVSGRDLLESPYVQFLHFEFSKAEEKKSPWAQPQTVQSNQRSSRAGAWSMEHVQRSDGQGSAWISALPRISQDKKSSKARNAFPEAPIRQARISPGTGSGEGVLYRHGRFGTGPGVMYPIISLSATPRGSGRLSTPYPLSMYSGTNDVLGRQAVRSQKLIDSQVHHDIVFRLPGRLQVLPGIPGFSTLSNAGFEAGCPSAGTEYPVGGSHSKQPFREPDSQMVTGNSKEIESQAVLLSKSKDFESQVLTAISREIESHEESSPSREIENHVSSSRSKVFESQVIPANSRANNDVDKAITAQKLRVGQLKRCAPKSKRQFFKDALKTLGPTRVKQPLLTMINRCY